MIANYLPVQYSYTIPQLLIFDKKFRNKIFEVNQKPLKSLKTGYLKTFNYAVLLVMNEDASSQLSGVAVQAPSYVKSKF